MNIQLAAHSCGGDKELCHGGHGHLCVSCQGCLTIVALSQFCGLSSAFKQKCNFFYEPTTDLIKDNDSHSLNS
jgi:hypothetical protein